MIIQKSLRSGFVISGWDQVPDSKEAIREFVTFNKMSKRVKGNQQSLTWNKNRSWARLGE